MSLLKLVSLHDNSNEITTLNIPEKINMTERDTSEVFQIVDEPATPEDGYPAFYKYITYNIRYPDRARANKIEGKVYVQFIVETDGSTSQIEVIKGLGYGCNLEVIRLIENGPKWKPAIHQNKLVRQKIVFPVTFKLWDEQNSEEQDILSEQPSFPGGAFAYNKYLQDNLKVNSQPPPNSTRNTVKIQFLVDASGQLSNFKILDKLDSIHNAEVLRVFKAMPKWEPGHWKNTNSKTVLTRTVSFDPYSHEEYKDAYEKFHLGNLKFQNEKYEKAIEKYNQAITIIPTELSFYLARAKSNLEISKITKACSDLSLILNNEEAYNLYKNYCE